MPGQKRKSKRATALLGEGYIAFTYYIILAASATLSIFNTDVIPFLMSAVGFKIGFDGLVALREADLKSINLLHKATAMAHKGIMETLNIQVLIFPHIFNCRVVSRARHGFLWPSGRQWRQTRT